MSTKLTRMAKAADTLLYWRVAVVQQKWCCKCGSAILSLFSCWWQWVWYSQLKSINHILNTNIFWTQVTHSVSHYYFAKVVKTKSKFDQDVELGDFEASCWKYEPCEWTCGLGVDISFLCGILRLVRKVDVFANIGKIVWCDETEVWTKFFIELKYSIRLWYSMLGSVMPLAIFFNRSSISVFPIVFLMEGWLMGRRWIEGNTR